MSHVLALARLLDAVEDDRAFLAATGEALGVLLATEPAGSAAVLLDVLGPRLDAALAVPDA